MKKTFILLAVCLSSRLFAQAQLTPAHLLCENLPDPIAIDAPQPRLSWQLEEAGGKKAGRGLFQGAYEIKVTPDDGKETAWSSGKINSDQSVGVAYAGQPLQSGQRYHWQVRVWDAKGKPSKWSEAASFRMALNTANWKAQWIEPGYSEDQVLRPSPFFRKKIRRQQKAKDCHRLYHRPRTL